MAKNAKRAKKVAHGGKRAGAGRKSAYGESTAVVCVRLPVSVIAALDDEAGSASDWIKAAALKHCGK